MKIGSLIRLKPDGIYGPSYSYNSEDALLIISRNSDNTAFNCISSGKYPKWIVYDNSLELFDLLVEGTL